MEYKVVTLENGATLKFQDITMGNAHELLQIVSSEMETVKLDFTTYKTEDGEDAVDQVSMMKAIGLRAISSKEISRAILKCGAQVFYTSADGMVEQRPVSNIDVFRDHRADLIPVMVEIAQDALAPFIEGLKSSYQNVLGKMEKSPPIE